ncbi:sialidase family protein [Kallotenue papyrolyticum]|uniref:sialidase family protein n=1 Tax=Kallotenue papyrolyticum TaxID=1325125 RepID=UPI000492C407|nr:sialidase family protein [Kallotenue papyrolyticum]
MSMIIRITLALSITLLSVTAYAAGDVRREASESVGGVRYEAKHPSLALSGSNLALAYTDGNALLALKPGASAGFPSTSVLGRTDSPTYFNHTVASGPQPDLFHSAWVEQGRRVLYRASNGRQSVIADGQNFAHYVDLVVASSGALLAIWRTLDDTAALLVSVSADGTGWSAPVRVPLPSPPRNRPRLAAGPNNELYLIAGLNNGDIVSGRWNGTNFDIASVSSDPAYEADPTITVAPNGTLYAAWRVVGAAPVWAERTARGWNVQALGPGEAAGPVAINADAGGNLHVAWSSNNGGNAQEIFYRVRPAGEQWSATVNVSGNGAVYDTNVAVLGVSGNPIVAHVAFESFPAGGGIDLRYARLVTPTDAPPANGRFFPETGQTVSGRLLQFWEQNGGLPVFGLPLNAEAVRQTLDGTYRMQLFERNRLELHPENPAPYDVLLGRLGTDLLYRQGRPWETLPREQPKPGCLYFQETQHNLCEPFLSYWRSHGLELGDRGVSFRESLALFGFPVTTPAMETNSSGHTVLTQWFERARFEYHPANPDPYKVLLGRLGAETGQ